MPSKGTYIERSIMIGKKSSGKFVYENIESKVADKSIKSASLNNDNVACFRFFDIDESGEKLEYSDWTYIGKRLTLDEVNKLIEEKRKLKREILTELQMRENSDNSFLIRGIFLFRQSLNNVEDEISTLVDYVSMIKVDSSIGVCEHSWKDYSIMPEGSKMLDEIMLEKPNYSEAALKLYECLRTRSEATQDLSAAIAFIAKGCKDVGVSFGIADEIPEKQRAVSLSDAQLLSIINQLLPPENQIAMDEVIKEK